MSVYFQEPFKPKSTSAPGRNSSNDLATHTVQCVDLLTSFRPTVAVVDFGVLIPTQAFGVHNGGFELEVIEDGLPPVISDFGQLVCFTKAPEGRALCETLMVSSLDSQAAIGDEVTLIGKDGNRAIIVDDVAGWSSTISHEILCGIFNRVPRSDTRQEARAE